jgi:hypothetical protein
MDKENSGESLNGIINQSGSMIPIGETDDERDISFQTISVRHGTTLIISSQIRVFLCEAGSGEADGINVLINQGDSVRFYPGTVFDENSVEEQVIHNSEDRAMELCYHDGHLDLQIPGDSFDVSVYLVS